MVKRMCKSTNKIPVQESVIRSRKNKTEMTHLLQVFPPEIWLRIFGASRPQHLKKIYQVFPFIENLLRPLRVYFLFGAVLRLVIPFLPFVNFRPESVKSIHFSGKHQTGSLILHLCRLVCVSWKASVDNILQDISYHLEFGREYFHGRPQVPGHLAFSQLVFEEMDTLSDFEEKIRFTHLEKNMNPFPGRHMFLRVNSPHQTRPGIENQSEHLLKQCGHHLWYLSLTIRISQPDCYYDESRRLLELLPNLKVLTIHLLPTTPAGRKLPATTTLFPRLPHLQFLRVSGQKGLRLLENLVSSNPHVKSQFGYDASYIYGQTYIDSD